MSQHRRDGRREWRKRETKSCLGSEYSAGANHESLGIADGVAARGNKLVDVSLPIGVCIAVMGAGGG